MPGRSDSESTRGRRSHIPVYVRLVFGFPLLLMPQWLQLCRLLPEQNTCLLEQAPLMERSPDSNKKGRF